MKYDYFYISEQPDGSWLCTIVHNQHTYSARSDSKAKAINNAERKYKNGNYERTTCRGYE